MHALYNHGWALDGVMGMLFGTLWMVLFIVIPIALLAVLLKYLFAKPRATTSGPAHPPPAQAPLDVLKERYARGEISREEFLQVRDDLLEK
mgnify:CR=1 FL=1